MRILALLLLTSFVAASAQHTTVTNVPTVVHDYDFAGTQLLLHSDDYTLGPLPGVVPRAEEVL
jgi:hypothetical protein